MKPILLKIGDKDNDDLAQRFDVATDKFPVIKLFNKKNIEKPIEFSGKCHDNTSHATLNHITSYLIL